MRFFTFLLTASTIAISANASITQKRVVPSFEECSGHITGYIRGIISSVSNIGDVPMSDVSDFNSFYRIVDSEIQFGGNVNAILALQSSIADQYGGLVSTIISKKPIVEKSQIKFSLTQYFFEYMSRGLDKFFTCLSPTLPAGRTKIYKASSDFKAAYGYMPLVSS